ncbi:MAG: helix-turn-helix domain-containing protein [Campylobacterota bacterium]|nr:helix-turn-helix domain-containing protein [Campylobacterota bacterium]
MMSIVVQVAATAVDATSFVTSSHASVEALKTANLLKSLSVNALVSGEKGVGKKKLAQYILPNAPIFCAMDFDELIAEIQSSSEIIITHIENSPNLKTIADEIEKYDTRVIATCSKNYHSEVIEELFGITIELPPLRERDEDIKALIEYFTSEAESIFTKQENFKFDINDIDLTQNATSLRRQLFSHYLLDDVNDYDLMALIEKYLYKRLGANNDYRDYLHLYEVPLIRAGLKKFRSQLKLAEVLGLNRNTLRKKIQENSDYKLED